MCIWKSRSALIVVFAMVVALGPTHSALAAYPERELVDFETLDKDRRTKAGRYPVGPRISRYLSAAAEEVDEGNPEEATRLLKKLKMNRLNPYERALVYRMLAFVAYGAGQPLEAIGYFKQFLAEEMLPIRDEARVRFNIAQLYASSQEWQLVIDSMNDWIRYVKEPDPLGFYLMGIAYYQLEDVQASIEYTKIALEFQREPHESWMRLLTSLYSQERDYENAALILEDMVLQFPKKEYWVQLSLIYGAREDYRRSLAVQQLAYTQELLTENKELLRLARSYLYHDLPYPAAEVLEKGLESGAIKRDAATYELLANSWISAREYERSLPPLRRAAELSDDGDLYVRLGQVQMQQEAWNEAAALLEQAVDKGKLEEPGNAVLLLGISYYNDDQPERARSSFKRAREFDSTRAEATRWITHIDTESEDEEEAAS